jgi:3-oxoacyl-[acyl-carrier protein] reductase
MDEEGLAATADLTRKAEARALCRRVDVSRREEMETLADWTGSETGRLDIWVNCAGVSYLHSILETDPEQAERVIAVNMMGAYWGCVAAARVMRSNGGGSIVNVSSAGGGKPVPGLGIYGMSKAAVNSLTWTSAAEFGPYGVRVNAVAPGWIDTPLGTQLYRDPTGRIDPVLRDRVREEMKTRSPLGILGRPSDVAFALLYLASEASRFVTGQILLVNGGESM